MRNLWEQIQRESEYTQIGMREIEERAASDIQNVAAFLDHLHGLNTRIKDGNPELLQTLDVDQPFTINLDDDEQMKNCLVACFKFSGPTATEISYIGNGVLGEYFVKNYYMNEIERLINDNYPAIKRNYDLTRQLPEKNEPIRKVSKI